MGTRDENQPQVKMCPVLSDQATRPCKQDGCAWFILPSSTMPHGSCAVNRIAAHLEAIRAK